MQLSSLLIFQTATLRDALAKIDENQQGFVLTTSAAGVVVGLATDGDIRRRLLEGTSLDAPIAACANEEFVWASPETPRELLLKQLDHRIRVIPLLNAARHLVGIVSRDHLPPKAEEPVYARSRSPVRISFSGGGSDLTDYFAGEGGAVINSTISLYCHATLRLRDDEKVQVHSLDLGQSLRADSLQQALSAKGEFGLIQCLLRAIQPAFGFELFIHSDFPMKSGLGGSAVVSAAILGCFNQFRRDQWDSHELAELAYQAERLYLGVAGGWQDQYATVFGGFNFMEFRLEQNIVHPLRIPADILLELEESLLLCDTGTSHDSGAIHKDQRRRVQQEDVRQLIQSNVALSYRMRNQLLRGKLQEFGQSLHEAWCFKRQVSSAISTPRLDSLYDSARHHGALGGKLLGAGGGGFLLFFVPPFRKHDVIAHIEQSGLRIRPFRFEKNGLCAWMAREGNMHPGTAAA